MKKLILLIFLFFLATTSYSQTFYVELAFFFNKKGVIIKAEQFTPKTSEIILLENKLIIWMQKSGVNISSELTIKETKRFENSKTRTIYFSSLSGEIIYIYDKKKNYSILKGAVFNNTLMALLLHDSSC